METYTVGELAHKFGVTVRTIQYYDKQSLLKAKIGSNGRRIYNKDDALRLQQILFLKSFGFSLGEIRDRLLNVDSPTEFIKLFKNQKIALTNKIADLQKVVGIMDKTMEEVNNGSGINMNRLVAMMSLMNQGSSFSFVLKYFGKEDLSKMMVKLGNPCQPMEVSNESEQIIEELIEMYRRGIAPNSIAGQKLAQKWLNMVNDFTKGDAHMMKTLLNVGHDVYNWPDEVEDFKRAVIDFLMEALAIYMEKNGMQHLYADKEQILLENEVLEHE